MNYRFLAELVYCVSWSNAVCLCVCLDVNQAGTIYQPLHTDTCLTCTDLLISKLV